MEDESYITDYTFNNSPFSSHSDLSFDDSVPLFPQDPVYNPTDFDHPNSASSLLMFSEEDYSLYAFDNPSPSSDNNDDNPSRASSTSDNYTPQLSFENMSFHSPNWSTAPLPKPHSPPRLVIDHPDSDGPRLQLVPATPITGITQPHTNWLNPVDKSNPSTRAPSPVPSPPIPSRSPSASPQPYNSNSSSPAPTPFLFPQPPPRSRSKSDTALEPPNWNTIGFPPQQQQQQQQQLSQPQPQPPPRQDYSGSLNSNFTFGQSSSSSNVPNADSNGFLSPDLNTGFTPLRRSKSDAGGRGSPAHHRVSRSEDIHYDANSGLGLQSGQYLFPPTSHQEFLNSHQQQQFLSPGRSGMRVPELPHHQHSQSLGGGQHYRRASSSTRSERGTSWDRGDSVPTNRASPYPTPNASPRLKYHDLQREEFDFNNGQGQAPSIASVSKPNVTTGRTANASHKRRKQEATFVCPVQGCGSTFTRSFNLKGHIRSHNEEKPFQCHWPGCGKGFARQHDCKRHEQLHTNYRPFTCEGCNKQFARMDALNRHLRSEGGADCVKIHEANGGADPNTNPNLTNAPSNTRNAATNNNNTSSSSSSASVSRSSSSRSSSAATLSTNNRGYTTLGDVGVEMMGMGMGMGGGTKMEDGPTMWGVGLSVAL